VEDKLSSRRSIIRANTNRWRKENWNECMVDLSTTFTYKW